MIDWLLHSKKIAHYSGTRPIYEIKRRWLVRQWDKLVEKYRKPPDWLQAGLPSIRVSHAPIEVKKKTHFDCCNQAVEIPLQIKYLEQRGKINTPERKAWAKRMIAKSQYEPKIDYQKHGHPNFNQKDFRHPAFTTREE